MPWTPDNPPPPAKNWPKRDREKCTKAANKALKEGKSEQEAIFACIRAAGRSKKQASEQFATSPSGGGSAQEIGPLPFTQAIDFARSRKVVLPDVYYGELVGVARARAFSVAGLSSIDQLQGVLGSLADSMQEGGTFADWKKRVRSREIGLGLPSHRLDNIFRTNLQTHYSRGRAENHRRNQETLPYFLWDAVDDSRTRPTHKGMDGHVAPQDDDIWKKWSAPAGYRCRCRRIALSERRANQMIKIDERKLANNPELSKARYESIIGGPDEGFDYDILDDFDKGIIKATSEKKHAISGAMARGLDNKLAKTPRRPSLDEAVNIGHNTTSEIFSELDRLRTPANATALQFKEQLFKRMKTDGRLTNLSAKVVGRNLGARLVVQESAKFPDSWIKKTDDFGNLRVKYDRGRPWHISFVRAEGTKRMPKPFGVERVTRGDGFITAADGSTAIHEYTHRVQHALPDVDDYFQAIHVRRNVEAGIKRKPLNRFNRSFGPNEFTREDAYIDAYFGKEYEITQKLEYGGRAGALEVMPMAVESVLAPNNHVSFTRLLNEDRELFDLVVGLMVGYDP